MKTVRKFTRDAFVRPCGCAKCVAKRSRTTDTKPTKAKTIADEKPRVDLNEIHRRFWAKLAGKE
ncbi:hypothetical protein [Paraburkholderia sediminicola]|uniref:hypothetical protein n=1 Tax=Paraburkholderia sediminicola TaxID=458836 RepID=UPI0038BDD64A